MTTQDTAITHSDERFRIIFEDAGVGVAQASLPDGRYTDVNRKMCEITGYTAAELTQMTFLDVTHPDDRSANREEVQALMRGERSSYAIEKRYIHKSGRQIWGRTTVSVVRDAAGRAVHSIGIIEDITDRKAAEAARDHLAAIVESSEDTIVGEDLQGIITTWNRGAQTMFGYTAAEAIGQNVEMLMPPGYESEVARTLREVMAGRHVAPYETLRRCKDGRIISAAVSVSPVRDRHGNIYGASKIARDITSRKMMENALRRANEDLEQFAWAVAHDLQEPARTLRLLSELLDRKAQNVLHGETGELLHEIGNNARRMQALVRDLLHYVRAVNPDPEAQQLSSGSAVLREALMNLTSSIQESGALIHFSELPVVPVYSAHLLQLFQNLIANAIRYRSEAPPHIDIFARGENVHWIFAVRDNGVGIAPEHHERIFKVFRRLHGQNIPGSGMGLAICHRIVSHYGGRIWVESSPGAGSTFCFTLPRQNHK